jgi:hypothetical protein
MPPAPTIAIRDEAIAPSGAAGRVGPTTNTTTTNIILGSKKLEAITGNNPDPSMLIKMNSFFMLSSLEVFFQD